MDGTRVAIASGSGAIQVWHTNSGLPVATLGDSGPVGQITLDRDGRRLASAGGPVSSSGRRPVRVWDVASGQLVRVLEGASSVIALTADGGRLAGAAGRKVLVWNLDTADNPIVLEGHSAEDQSSRLQSRWNQTRGVCGWRRADLDFKSELPGAILATEGSRLGTPTPDAFSEDLALAFGPDGDRLYFAKSESVVGLWRTDSQVIKVWRNSTLGGIAGLPCELGDSRSAPAPCRTPGLRGGRWVRHSGYF